MSYDAQQLHDLWLEAVRNVDHREPDASDKLTAWDAAAVALAESNGNPNAENTNSNGTIDRGLWQINSVHGDLSTFDPMKNAEAAYIIWKGAGPSWKPWATAWSNPFSSGYGAVDAPAWKIRLSSWFTKVTHGQVGGQAKGIQDVPVIGPVVSAAKGAISWTEALGNLASHLADPNLWIYVGKMVAAAGLFVVGMLLIFHNSIGVQSALQVAKTVK